MSFYEKNAEILETSASGAEKFPIPLPSEKIHKIVRKKLPRGVKAPLGSQGQEIAACRWHSRFNRINAYSSVPSSSRVMDSTSSSSSSSGSA